jgi:uncharacterized protein YlxW (UPF0749 family)
MSSIDKAKLFDDQMQDSRQQISILQKKLNAIDSKVKTMTEHSEAFIKWVEKYKAMEEKSNKIRKS